MNKLLILYYIIRQLTSNSTEIMLFIGKPMGRSIMILQTTTNSQTTMWTKQNDDSYTEQQLFGTLHSTQVLYTFFQNYYYLIIKLLFRKQKKTLGSYTNKKVLLSRDSPCFFPAFLFLDEIFFLKLTRTAWHEFLFSQLFHCGIHFLAWVC